MTDLEKAVQRAESAMAELGSTWQGSFEYAADQALDESLDAFDRFIDLFKHPYPDQGEDEGAERFDVT